MTKLLKRKLRLNDNSKTLSTTPLLPPPTHPPHPLHWKKKKHTVETHEPNQANHHPYQPTDLNTLSPSIRWCNQEWVTVLPVHLTFSFVTSHSPLALYMAAVSPSLKCSLVLLLSNGETFELQRSRRSSRSPVRVLVRSLWLERGSPGLLLRAGKENFISLGLQGGYSLLFVFLFCESDWVLGGCGCVYKE